METIYVLVHVDRGGWRGLEAGRDAVHQGLVRAARLECADHRIITVGCGLLEGPPHSFL